MTALTTGRNTGRVEETRITLRMAPEVTIYQGAIVAIDQDGQAVPPTIALGLLAVGRAEETVTTAAEEYTTKITVTKGAFWYANYPSNAVASKHIGRTCYMLDDQTVCKTDAGGTLSPAGRVVNVDPFLGVCVALGQPGFDPFVP